MKARRPVRWLIATLALLLVASWGISGALRYGWARRSLLARLSASFGRPVEAGRFTFSLLQGPRLVAQSVTVAEDPRFGQEYFLRAEQLTASLRWWPLLRGRVEFGTLYLSRPSLNLVHLPDGHWNVESWLPPLQSPGAASRSLQDAAEASAPAGRRLSRIQVDGGRINFKLGPEKLLFALAGVSGRLDQDRAGRWNLDVTADPMRASVALQQAGRLRLRGSVAGTSARLRPATLILNWNQASLADTLRLATGRDFGVRGALTAEFSAKIEDALPGLPVPQALSGWKISGTLQVAGMHRWDLPARAGDPAVKLAVNAAWRPGTSRLEVETCTLESPHSQVQATAELDWSRGFNPRVQILSSRIALADVLAWPRSFRTSMANDLALEGSLSLRAVLAGWPVRIEQFSLGGTEILARVGGLGGPIRVAPFAVGLERSLFVLKPVAVTLPGAALPVPARAGSQGAKFEPAVPAGALRVEGALGPIASGKRWRDWPYRLAVSGQTSRTQDFAAVLRAFGQPVGTTWKVEGPIALQLTWAGPARDAPPAPGGTLDLRGLRVTTALLNQPAVLTSGTIELRPGGPRVKLAAAEALGARWRGTLDRKAGEQLWNFDLVADQLDAAELDRWVGPRARPGFFERMLPFAAPSPAAPARAEALERLAARGRLRVGQVSVAPVHLEKLDAAVELKGRRLFLRRAQAGFSDGRVTGEFEAQLSAEPAYTFRGQFDRVNLAALSSSAAWPQGRLAGLASGRLQLAARGIGAERLRDSFSGQGDLHVREPALRGLDLTSGLSSGAEPRPPAEGRFVSASGDFRVSGGRVHLDPLLLASRDDHYEVRGSVDFASRVELRIRTLRRGQEAPVELETEPEWEWALGGTLDVPQLTHQTHIAGNAPGTPVLPPAPGAGPGRR